MNKVILIILLAFAVNAFSQEVLLSENVQADSIRPTRGPNLKHFTQGYIGIGFPVYTNEAVTYTKVMASTDFNFGIRYKHRVTNTFAMGLDLGMHLAAFKLKQDEPAILPESENYDREKFQINTLSGSAYVRINAGRRGNYIGNYLDLGAYGGWNMIKKYKGTYKNEADEKVKLITSRLNYVEDFSYGGLARLGVNRYALTAQYRLSDIFNNEIPELPRLVVGIEVGLFK